MERFFGSGATVRFMVRLGFMLLLALAIPIPHAAAEGLSVLITEPADGSKVSGTVTAVGVAGRTTPGQNVLFVEVEIDSGGWDRAQGTDQWSFKFDSTDLPNGWHVLRARCSDGTSYSGMAAIEIEVANSGGSGELASLGICVFGVFALVLFVVALVVYLAYKAAARQADSQRAAVRPAPLQPQSYPARIDYYARQYPYQTPVPGGSYPVRGRPGHDARPPGAGFSETGPEAEYSPAPAGDGNGAEGEPELPEDGGALPPPVVVEHDGTEAEAPVVEVVETGYDLAGASPASDEAGPAGPVEVLPEDQPEPDGSMPGADRQARIMKALTVMPRGVPLPLLGIPMHELAEAILRAERQNTPGGSPLVRLKGRWYHADETNLKEFMVEHRQ